MIMELVLRDLIKSWISRKLAWRLDDFVLTAICYADDVVLVAVSVTAAEVMAAGDRKKLKEVGLTVGAQKTHWTSCPKMVDKSIMVDGLAVLWQEVLEFVGSMVCLDGNARHAIAHSSAQANKCLAKWRPVLKSSWLPRMWRLNIVKTTMWQAFLWISSVWTAVKGQNCKLKCEDGGECCWREEAAVDGAGPVVETLAQNWSSVDCEMQYECAGGHWRSYAQLGWSCGKDGLQRHLCEGLEMPRWRWRQLHWKEVEKDRWSGPHPQRFKIYRWEDMVAGEVSKFVGNADDLSKTVQDDAGCLHFAQNRGSWKQLSKCGKSPVQMVPSASGDPCASGTVGTDAGANVLAVKGWVRERFGEHLVPLSLYQANCDIALMFSWYRAGYGWLVMACCETGRRSGSWSGNSEDVWFCETCRVEPQRLGALLPMSRQVGLCSDVLMVQCWL